MLSILLLFLYPVFFYKNILLSFVIVFLIANSSFGVRDEEEEEEEEERELRGRGERGGITEEWERWTGQAVSYQRERERERERERH